MGVLPENWRHNATFFWQEGADLPMITLIFFFFETDSSFSPIVMCPDSQQISYPGLVYAFQQ
jgi:hypothetical protein